jgi:hypothetical protein
MAMINARTPVLAVCRAGDYKLVVPTVLSTACVDAVLHCINKEPGHAVVITETSGNQQLCLIQRS